MDSSKKNRKKQLKKQDRIVDNLVSRAKSAPSVENDPTYDKISAINSRSTLNEMNNAKTNTGSALINSSVSGVMLVVT